MPYHLGHYLAPLMRRAGFSAVAVPRGHEQARLTLHLHLLDEQLLSLTQQEDVVEDSSARPNASCLCFCNQFGSQHHIGRRSCVRLLWTVIPSSPVALGSTLALR